MEGLLSLLLFAALFYVMMRFGCGAHMVHGHGGGGGHAGHGGHAGQGGSGLESGATDPVCGMSVEPGKGYAKMHEGRQYRFCSRRCLDQFENAPQRYANPTGGSQ